MLRHTGDADVEPYRRVEGRPLVDDQPLELRLERLRLLGVYEVAVLVPPGHNGPDDPVDDLLQRPLPVRRAQGAPEILLGQDVGGVDAPATRHLHPWLFEGNGPGGPVGDASVPTLPRHRLVRIGARGGEVATDADAGPLGGNCHGGESFLFRTSTRRSPP